MYRKIRLSQDDIKSMIFEAARRIRTLSEENVFNNGRELGEGEVAFEENLKIANLGICVGMLMADTGKIYPNGIGADQLEYGKTDEGTLVKKLQDELDLRRAHLTGKLAEFGRKMNGLDPEINFSASEFKPVPYKADVLLEMPLPSGAHGMDGRKTSPEVEEMISQMEGRFGKAGMRPFNTRQVPGVPTPMIKVGEIDVVGYECVATYSKPGFQLGGYRYVGVVQPYTNADAEDTDALYSDVKLTSEFAGNAELLEYLKSTSSKIRCDGCGKKTTRSFYYIFMDNNGKLFYYGRNCATRIFGIDVMEKLERFMMGLNKLGEDFANGAYQGGNTGLELLKKIVCVMAHDNVLDRRAKFDYKGILYRAGNLGQTYNSDSELDDFFARHNDEVQAKTLDFLEHGDSFFRGYDKSAANDFAQKVITIGIAITSGDDKAITRGGWAVPYALQMYFTEKVSTSNRAAQKDSFGEIEQYPQFYGYKTFDCEVVRIESKTGKNGRSYSVVQAVTVENGIAYGIMWYDWDGQFSFAEGSKLKIGGTYSKYTSRGSRFATLDNVKVQHDAPGQETGGSGNIEIGDRLKGEKVQVKKVFDKCIVVTTSGGFDFYIYTRDYNTGAPKYPINFTEGMTLTVDGTMQMSGNGKPYLNRCKIMA